MVNSGWLVIVILPDFFGARGRSFVKAAPEALKIGLDKFQGVALAFNLAFVTNGSDRKSSSHSNLVASGQI